MILLLQANHKFFLPDQNMEFFLYLEIVITALGLIIGSFLTACIYRVPYGRKPGAPSEEELRGEYVEEEQCELPTDKEVSLLYPRRSFCPNCKEQLLWWHNIPFFSWVFLGGKCWFCKNQIPFRYPLVELLSAGFALLSFTMFDPVTACIVYCFAATLLVISFIDIEYFIIPDVISLPASGIALLLASLNTFFPLFSWPVVNSLWQSLYGVLAGAGFLLLVAELFFRLRGKIGLGLGDVKLLLFVGILFGPEAALYCIFVGSFLGSIIGILLLLLGKLAIGKRFGLGTPLPFGPYLALGALCYIFSRGYNPLL